MPTTLDRLVDQIRASHYAFSPAEQSEIFAALSRGVPATLVDFYRLSDGALIAEGDDFRAPDGREFRFRIPRLSDLETVQTFGFIYDNAPLFDLSANWWQFLDCGDSDWLAIDESPEGKGRVIDVFHETVGEPGTHQIITTSLAAFLEQLLAEQVLAEQDCFWLGEKFENLGYV